MLVLALLDDEAETEEVYCRLHEDVLVKKTQWRLHYATFVISARSRLFMGFYLNQFHDENRSFSCSGSSSNRGHNRFTTLSGSSLMRSMNALHASNNPRVVS